MSEGVPEVGCALAMLDLCKRMLPSGKAPGPESKGIWPARIGIHCGPVMMAVMDGARLRFDIWGESEHRGQAGTVILSNYDPGFLAIYSRLSVIIRSWPNS